MRRITALAPAGAIVVVLIVAQLVLPGIAAQRIRDRLSRSGTVLGVQVDAFPAIKLLWRRIVSMLTQNHAFDPKRRRPNRDLG